MAGDLLYEIFNRLQLLPALGVGHSSYRLRDARAQQRLFDRERVEFMLVLLHFLFDDAPGQRRRVMSTKRDRSAQHPRDTSRIRSASIRVLTWTALHTSTATFNAIDSALPATGIPPITSASGSRATTTSATFIVAQKCAMMRVGRRV